MNADFERIVHELERAYIIAEPINGRAVAELSARIVLSFEPETREKAAVGVPRIKGDFVSQIERTDNYKGRNCR